MGCNWAIAAVDDIAGCSSGNASHTRVGRLRKVNSISRLQRPWRSSGVFVFVDTLSKDTALKPYTLGVR
jgi:hypothetical protein